jgi:cyclohexanone monooxygenase
MKTESRPDFDVVVIGAGFSGMYQLYRLRELGLAVKGIEAGGGVGGVWYWNRYPGCRVDSESVAYAYFWSKRLREEFVWTEHFAGQPEVLRYLNRAADVMDIRKDYLFNNRVRKLTWSDADAWWSVELEDMGAAPITARFVISAVGPLSAVQWPRFEGIHTFQGDTYHTALWPRDERGYGGMHIDFTGKRVGVVGTGSSGTQIVQTLGPVVNQMVVFQRTPNWCLPLGNRPMTAAEREEQQRRWTEIAAICERSVSGFPHLPVEKNTVDVPAEEREAFWEVLYRTPGYAFWLANYQDIVVDPQANVLVSDFVARKIRERVRDPRVADKLIPRNHGYGTRRVPMEKNYYEVFNQPNVTLVDLRETPVERVTPAGIRTTDRKYELDVIIYATGFDAIMGGITRLNVLGRGGRALNNVWADGPQTYLGLQVHGFPNFITLVGAHNGASFCNIPRCSGVQVEWITDFLAYMRGKGYSEVEPTQAAEENWTKLVYETANMTLLAGTESWFTGTNQNIAGREKFVKPLVWAGGNPAYRDICNEIAARGYEGFVFR